jgi:hypothetical protein
MKRVAPLAAIVLAAWATGPVRADTIEDPLRGFCTGTLVCANTNVGGTAQISAQSAGNLDGFGFNSSPNNTGTLSLLFLVPSNTPNANILNINVTGSAAGSGVLDTNGFGAGITTFTAGALQGSNPTLAAFLQNNATPDNNLNQYLAATDTLDAGANAYDVYVVTLPGLFSLTTTGSTDVFNADCNLCQLPAGTFAVGFLNTNVTGGTQNGVIGTANSEALFATPFLVPGPIVGAGLPGMVTALLGLVTLARSRRKRAHA